MPLLAANNSFNTSKTFLTGGLTQLANDYSDEGVQIVGISSNSIEVKPMDGPEEMAADAKEQGDASLIGLHLLNVTYQLLNIFLPDEPHTSENA